MTEEDWIGLCNRLSQQFYSLADSLEVCGRRDQAFVFGSEYLRKLARRVTPDELGISGFRYIPSWKCCTDAVEECHPLVMISAAAAAAYAPDQMDILKAGWEVLAQIAASMDAPVETEDASQIEEPAASGGDGPGRKTG